jgi:FkbM family methyltransferase
MNLILKIKNKILFYKENFLYFLEELMLSEKLLKLENNPLIFDIGYNKGKFSKKILSYFKPSLILGIEANPSIIKNSFSHPIIKKINYLVSDDTLEEKYLYINDNFLGMSTASLDILKKSRFSSGSIKQEKLHELYNYKIKIKVITLDKLINLYGTPDLIKIDVEGHEFEVLKGLNTKAKKITFEWTEENYDGLEKSIKHLMDLGYDKFGVVGYFTNRNNLDDKVLFSRKGDPFLIEPDYFEWKKINLRKYIDENRKINYGMIWAK